MYFFKKLLESSRTFQDLFRMLNVDWRKCKTHSVLQVPISPCADSNDTSILQKIYSTGSPLGKKGRRS